MRYPDAKKNIKEYLLSPIVTMTRTTREMINEKRNPQAEKSTS